MSAIPAGPLRAGDQAATIRKRDLVGWHSGMCSIPAVLIDIERETHRMQGVPDTAMGAVATYEADRIALPIECRNQALKRACCARSDVRGCTGGRSHNTDSPPRAFCQDAGNPSGTRFRLNHRSLEAQ